MEVAGTRLTPDPRFTSRDFVGFRPGRLGRRQLVPGKGKAWGFSSLCMRTCRLQTPGHVSRMDRKGIDRDGCEYHNIEASSRPA